jgi:hypothetical protein
MSEGPRLLAMTATGDVFFADDGFGTVWLFEALAGGDPLRVERSEVDDAVARHGIERVDREFASWDALDEFRRGRAGAFLEQFAPASHELTVDDARRGVAQARRWLQGNERALARKLALHLLGIDAVRLDKALMDEVRAVIEEATEPRLRVPRRLPRGDLVTRSMERYRDRWELAAA